ncbi:MAG: DNA topoisomerase VI subunit B [Thermoprotei archaeon]|nr:MAG: DNA topoisomerase VI subunit B [Thermoprotei archaeon]
MREKYSQLSPSEFFYRNREVAGFSNPVRAVYQTVRELVENALDATEMYGLLPEVDIEVEVEEDNPSRIHVCVEDNGVGISPLEVPNVFGRVFYGSKYVLRQTRGVFGLGVKMAVLYAQLTTGQPVRVVTSTRKSRFIYEFEVMIDIERNMPVVRNLRVWGNDKAWHGTRVELVIRGNWYQARRRVEEYVRRTAMITPYATIRFRGPGSSLTFERSSTKLPRAPLIGKPHPKGVDVEMLRRMIESCDEETKLADFLSNNFDGVGPVTSRRFCEWAGFDSEVRVHELTVEELELLAARMQAYDGWRRPKPLTLSPLGEELLKRGVRSVLKPEFVTAVTRSPSSYAGHPFIVEVALAYGGDIPPSGEPLLFRFANRIPLLYDEGVDVAKKVVRRINWSVYKVKFPAPLAIVAHICSTKVPFKGVGKEAVADVPEVEKELESGLRVCARRLRRHLSRVERMMKLKRWEVTVMRYLDEVVDALSYVTGSDEKILRARMLELVRSRLSRRARVRA